MCTFVRLCGTYELVSYYLSTLETSVVLFFVSLQGFHFLVTFVAGGRIKDTQCGFKVRPILSSESIATAVVCPDRVFSFQIDIRINMFLGSRPHEE